MKVIMKTPSRDGSVGKPAGATLTLDDREAACLMARGLCTVAPDRAEGKPPRVKKDGD